MQFSPDQSTRASAQDNLDAASSSVTGPVGILGTLFPRALQGGLPQIILLSAIISLILSVMNSLPIPALDGGRWFTSALFKLIKKPLTKDLEEKIQGTGFIILMGLIILVTIADVSKII
jgi:regulator of sigma E protease